jgi:hypothetical protein
LVHGEALKSMQGTWRAETTYLGEDIPVPLTVTYVLLVSNQLDAVAYPPSNRSPLSKWRSESDMSCAAWLPWCGFGIMLIAGSVYTVLLIQRAHGHNLLRRPGVLHAQATRKQHSAQGRKYKID